MLKLFQNLTKQLSIRNIVILGVIIMALILFAFAITMTYLSSTIKHDQNTLQHILTLQKQNQQVLNAIKDINYVNNKILISSTLEQLNLIEKELFEGIVFKTVRTKNKAGKYLKNYNENISSISSIFSKIVDLQRAIFDSKSTILSHQNELHNYEISIDALIKSIGNETESIYGKASLLTKRYNRSIKNLKGTSAVLDNKLLVDLGRVITISSDLNSSILKLPAFIYKIDSTSNSDLIVSIEKNNLSQLVLLFEDSLIRLTKFAYIQESFNPSLLKIRTKFADIKEQSSFIISLKYQLLKEEDSLKSLLEIGESINNEVFSSIKSLDEISNGIKLDILTNSNAIYKKSTTTILIVGTLCLILLSLSAATLISRINVPLEFIIKYMDSIINKKRSLNSKLPIFSSDEFGKLSKSFNNMTSIIGENIKEIEHLNEEIEDTQKEVIFTMGAIGESRSKETGNHVKRVAEYSKILAIKCGLSLEESELLKEASPMHDIGKVGIPDSILKKDDKLNEQEWVVMKTHAKLGYEMLKSSDRKIFKAAAIVAYEHHEKWDGTGYPRGLHGKQIHIYGRITAIADVFDALGSDRCYKKAWPIAEVKEYFVENKEKHFDPRLVDIFFENFDEFLFVRDKYKDVF